MGRGLANTQPHTHAQKMFQSLINPDTFDAY
uniref:Uncharacterized protein n=1 Tax=Anguilla anguilla TaxID=7936 RepID=A0A0E9PDZ5_ANGAN